MAEDVQLPRVGVRLPGEEAHRRRLAGAVRPEQPEADPRLDIEVEAVDGVDVAEALVDAAKADHGHSQQGARASQRAVRRRPWGVPCSSAHTRRRQAASLHVMAEERKPEPGRGERVLPGAWRLRLPLPWPGVPHGNAWALRAGDGIVLVDTGIHSDTSFGELELALRMVGLSVDDVQLLVCTHAHSDHYGQAAAIVERTGCELWMHPDIEHMTAPARDPEASFDERAASAIRSGVPEEMVREGRESRRG